LSLFVNDNERFVEPKVRFVVFSDMRPRKATEISAQRHDVRNRSLLFVTLPSDGRVLFCLAPLGVHGQNHNLYQSEPDVLAKEMSAAF
jgi:hypothetical protein